jgi:uncharacterized membrane protein
MRRWEAAFRLVGVGFFIGGAIVAGVLLGHWLDTRLFWLVGLILVLIVAFYGVYQMLLPFRNNKRN